jgi:uncharacterized membrane protein YeaQ/YmgE (transglycosylase-associated protein family)
MMPRFILITIGLIVGFYARTMAGKRGPKGLWDITLGIIGALIGAWLFGFIDYFSTPGLAEFSERNLLIDIIGSATLFVIFQALTSSTE